jgi:hypothetical protein
MPDILDTLEWRPWPKDPESVYADIPGVARVSKTAGSNGTSYAVRQLDDDGIAGGWRYIHLERGEAARILNDAVKALSRLQAS